jgi:nicotinamidase-related amidase
MQTFAKVGLDALLTPEECVLLLIDHQPFQLANVNSHDPTIVINNVTALAKTARAYDIPTILTTVNEERGWLALAGELQRDWARTERLGEVAQLFIDHAGATGSAFLWETQLLGASESKRA